MHRPCSAALRKIEDAMRNIEAAVSPRPAEDPTMHFNTFWDPDYSSEQVDDPLFRGIRAPTTHSCKF